MKKSAVLLLLSIYHPRLKKISSLDLVSWLKDLRLELKVEKKLLEKGNGQLILYVAKKTT